MFFAVAIACALFTATIAGPLCYQCDHVTTPADCHKGVQCSDNQRCFTQKLVDFSNTTYYKLGCENDNVCKALPVALIGKRDVIDQEHDVIDQKLQRPISRQATHMSLCIQCCVDDACNHKGGCGSDTGMIIPTNDPGTGILIPTQKPVDGQWSKWSAWTACSQSCGAGFHQKSRTCTSPTPSNGGHDCFGKQVHAAMCSLQECPDNCTAHRNYHRVTVQEHGTSTSLCLSLGQTRVSWRTARTRCHDTDGDLATATSYVFNKAIANFAKNRLSIMDSHFWIGLYGGPHHSGQNWTWVDHSNFSYTNFHQLHNATINTCALSDIDSIWWTDVCGEYHPYVCQIKV